MEHTCTATQTSQITSIHQVDARCLLPYTQLSYLSGLNMLEHVYNVAQTGHAIQILRIHPTLHQLDARYLQYHTQTQLELYDLNLNSYNVVFR